MKKLLILVLATVSSLWGQCGPNGHSISINGIRVCAPNAVVLACADCVQGAASLDTAGLLAVVSAPGILAPGTGVTYSNGLVTVPQLTVAGVTVLASLPPGTGTNYLCAGESGQLRSSTTPCSGQPPTIWTAAELYSGTYTSGLTAAGAAGTTCVLTFVDGSMATVALSDTDTIAGSTPLVLTGIVLDGFSTPPTTAAVSNGTATACSGTPLLSTALSKEPTGSGYFYNNLAAPLTVILPALSSGLVASQLHQCFRNYTGQTGAISLKAPASTYIDIGGANGDAAGLLVSGGALGDYACVVAGTTTQYFAEARKGTWAPPVQ